MNEQGGLMKEENRFLRAIDSTNEWVGKCVSVLIPNFNIVSYLSVMK